MFRPSISNPDYHQLSGTQQDYLDRQYQAQESWRQEQERRAQEERRLREESERRAQEEERRRKEENERRSSYQPTFFSSPQQNNVNTNLNFNNSLTYKPDTSFNFNYANSLTYVSDCAFNFNESNNLTFVPDLKFNINNVETAANNSSLNNSNTLFFRVETPSTPPEGYGEKIIRAIKNLFS